MNPIKYIDIERLVQEKDAIRKIFTSKKPFYYSVIDNIFLTEAAEQILLAYPSINDGQWDGTTYIDQKNKFTKTQFEEGSVLKAVFDELNSAAFLTWLSSVTGIEDLLGDPELFGGGLHQSIKGAHLNVHVDYNIHPSTKFHRRLNVIVYMNKNWKEEYEGHLELWDLSGGKMTLLEKVTPAFNRCVIFETNEISFHGHPKPLNTPEGISRKSLAAYYYTKNRPVSEIVPEHNTIYVNTEGLEGQVKRFSSGVKAFLERINKSS